MGVLKIFQETEDCYKNLLLLLILKDTYWWRRVKFVCDFVGIRTHIRDSNLRSVFIEIIQVKIDVIWGEPFTLTEKESFQLSC